jgi:N6-adenosine-specific RNA methylase IME4
MKKTLWILMAGALAASVIAATAQEVLSQNAVGYIKKTLPAGGKLVMMSIPLDSMTEENIVFGRTSVAQEAVQNSTVYFWDTTLQTWSFGAKGIKGWGSVQSNKVVAAGEAFFLKGPSTDPDRDVTITGEVPAEATIPRTIPGGGALGTLGNPYPVDFKFGESALANNASQNSTVYFWDEALQTWSFGAKGIKGWGTVQSNKVVAAGEGFFLKEIGTDPSKTTWTAAKPYTWPE